MEETEAQQYSIVTSTVELTIQRRDLVKVFATIVLANVVTIFGVSYAYALTKLREKDNNEKEA